MNEIRAFWRDFVPELRIETASPAIDLMVNGWLAYQNVSCRVWGRSAFYRSSGAFGYRDQLQESSAPIYLRPIVPELRFYCTPSIKFVEGDVLHWWHP